MAHLPMTTAAIATVTTLQFDEENHDNIRMGIVAELNGPAPGAGDTVVFPKDAVRAVKAEAVRTFINAHIGSYEPGFTPLTNANIQISGLPI